MLLASLISTAINPVEVRPLRAEGARRAATREAKPAAQEGAARHHQRHARQRPEQSAAQAVSRARRLRPHRRARPHRQHRVRRSPLAANYQVGDAPVSYPYLWNIWKFDWVQYNGSVAQPLARNIGEALGVGAIMPLMSDMRRAAAAGRSASAARWTSPACIASSTRCNCCARRAGRRISSAPSIETKAARGEVLFEAALPGMPRPASSRSPRAQQASAPLKPSPDSSGASK